MGFIILKKLEDEVAQDLKRLIAEFPGIGYHIVERMGLEFKKIGRPLMFDGSKDGLNINTGYSYDKDLVFTIRSRKTTSTATIFSRLSNLFENYKSRPRKMILKKAGKAWRRSTVADRVISQVFKEVEAGRRDWSGGIKWVR